MRSFAGSKPLSLKDSLPYRFTSHFTPLLTAPYLRRRWTAVLVLVVVRLVHLFLCARSEAQARSFNLFWLALLHKPAPPSPFTKSNLPIEVYLLIVAYAASPVFAPDRLERRKPYSTALALCLVSRTVRRTVLPELLHTILLSGGDNVTAFIHTLRIQERYAQQGNHLHFDYVRHVNRIWIGETRVKGNYYDSFDFLCPPSGDFSLLAAVLLASESLAVDVGSMFLLDGCLEYARNSHNPSNVNKSSLPPCRIKTLTISGDLADYCLADTARVYAFLASISYIIFLSPTRFHFKGLPLDPRRIPDNLLRYNIFERMSRCTFPWDSLQNLQSVSLAIPYMATPLTSWCWGAFWDSEIGWKDVRVELRTFTTPMYQLSSPWAQEISDAYNQRGEGRISSADVRATLRTGGTGTRASIHWEQAWAYGLRT